MNCDILIQNGSAVYAPPVEDGIEWSTERKGSPGKLTFKVPWDKLLKIQEGNAVQFKVDGQPAFYGYLFSKSFDKDGLVNITCYDQLRYLKNKDTYVYREMTASQVLGMICKDFFLSAGEVEDTGYIIANKAETDKTLFDIIQNALDDTMMNTKKLYVLYDLFGKITLKNIASMKVPLLIDEETGENFEYTSSIDSQTYNQIKLTYDNDKTGLRDVYITKDSSHINEWGVLQYYESVKEGVDGKAKADVLLGLYNKKSRNLSVSGVLGDLRVRAGSAPVVRLNLLDVKVNNFMVCDRATHKFKNNEHTMDLTLIGGDYIG